MREAVREVRNANYGLHIRYPGDRARRHDGWCGDCVTTARGRVVDLDAVTDELLRSEASQMPRVDIETLAVIRPLGMGGQGGVWLSVDPATGTLMAVKQIRKGRLTMLPKKAMTRALTERECLLDRRRLGISLLITKQEVIGTIRLGIGDSG